ncbi:GTP pyrophosphokinase [Fusobacterium necrophorum]|uniref:GTP pyrophosphokinase n=1 Tax=Fusobacterium necrophorum BL TaxID=1441732 RepID=A0AB73BTY5_9FUSO|nr:GTP pyrophosphokinase [Fusobacterium necrophorum]AYZ74426.1 GTP pyrophosphokinase [Fusobacterium necrophorum]AZW09688.1 GTP pyrophosphokinase [Fusobacterium necrophorum subsp. necrophorum]KDE61254.1 GTP pyrophosphokinase [Fusobacterium necrophorum BL]KDE70319.1 GTP pyrophosphokinase [Fusobacterium necrophorum BFTR-2]KDE70696.1 GTP pyrophosphokinase [Fusobacterium necrophorum DAB]
MSIKLDQTTFFEEFTIDKDYFDATGLEWEELVHIYEDYVQLIPSLEKEAEYIVSKLIDAPNVHSVRRRVKKAKHLIEKIIRKGKKYKDRNISVDNYREIVTDLIGIRVLHLFKDDWKGIHHNILNLWELSETPQVNIRRGDYNLQQFRESISDLNCEIIVREHGYRSVHYLVKIPITISLNVLVEIQVRTVFEEAWSEIDHIMRYPYDTDNPVITEYLAIFNRMVGCADEMGTFLKKVKKDFSLGKELPENFVPRDLDLKFK